MTSPMISPVIGALDAEAALSDGRPNDFERLIRLVRDNERLAAELEAVRSRSRAAWDYLAAPGSNPVLARAQLDRLRVRRSAILARLRANRVEARALLGHEAPGCTPARDEWLN